VSKRHRGEPLQADPQAGSGLAMGVATACGCGYLRPGPGTWAAAAAAALSGIAIEILPNAFPLVIASGAVVATIGGLLCSGTAIRRTGQLDPSLVVIDEVAGMWVALAVLPPALLRAETIAVLTVAWLLFRIFDIGKPWPLNRLEDLPGAIGIMSDDLAAGALAGMLTLAVFH
jgi:phosphatidylglycerophosphatase A